MTLVQLFILGLAVWRLTHLLVWEEGPGRIFIRLRERLGILHDDDGHPYQYPDTFVAQLFSCVWCLSIWISLFSLFFWIWPTITIVFATIPALSAIAIVVEKLTAD